MIKKIINTILKQAGFEIRRIPQYVTVPQNLPDWTMEAGLMRLSKLTHIQTVIDVGASNGAWSRQCLPFFPEANYLLIEAQKEHLAELEPFVAQHKNISYQLAAAGNKVGEIYFDNTDLFGGLASEQPVENGTVVPVTTINHEVEQRNLKAPFLIKLDTHGYEVPILEGASNILSQTNALIIETYNFQLTDSSLRFWEMCEYLKNVGFLPIDMVDFVHRQRDTALWQMDTFFIRAEHPVFQYNQYE